MALSVLGTKNIVFAAIDDKASLISIDELKQRLRKNPTLIWNKKKQPFEYKCIDLIDILNWYKIDNLSKINELFPSKHLNAFLVEQDRLKACLASFKQIGIDVSKKDISYIIPKHIGLQFVLRRNELLNEIFDWITKQDFYDDKLLSWFSNIKTAIINDLTGEIKIKDGNHLNSFLFAENFRFKADKNGLNLFTLQKEQRDILVPQDDNSFIYCADFKQFEFRTFLMLNKQLDIDFSDTNIYEQCAKMLNTTTADAKEQCISYMYGSPNKKLEKVFPKQFLLDKINNQRFDYREKCVIVRREHPDHKKIHTIVQSISQYIILEKIESILLLLKNKKSKFLYPHHDNLVFSINNDEIELIDKIKNLIEDDVYKIKEYQGSNFKDISEYERG